MNKILHSLLFLFLFPPLLNAQTITYSGTNVGIGSANPGQVLDVQGTVRALFYSGTNPYVKMSNTQSSGVSGGSTTSGAWEIYPLNTIDVDTAGIATLGSNEITLPAGTYLVRGNLIIYHCDAAQMRLYNDTDSAVVLLGASVESSNSTGSDRSAPLIGMFTITATKTLEVDYQVQTAKSGNGLGVATGFGTEIYGQIEFTKIS